MMLLSSGIILLTFMGPFLYTLGEGLGDGLSQYIVREYLTPDERGAVDQLNEKIQEDRTRTDFEELILHELTDDRSDIWV